MLNVIFTSLAGMNAYQSGLQTISNNVANLNTPGFKLSNPLFRDLVAQFGGAMGMTHGGVQGNGVSADRSTLSFAQGTFQDTGNSFSAALDGSGFFVVDENGKRLYTRAGQFEIDKDGFLVEVGTQAKVVVSTDTSPQGFLNIRDFRTHAPSATTQVDFSGALVRAVVGTPATPYSMPQFSINDTTGAAVQLTAKLTPATTAAGHATTQVLLRGTLARGIGFGGPTPYTLQQVQLYDTGGNVIEVSVTMTPDAENPLHWTAAVVDASNHELGSGSILFNADGTPAVANSSFTVPVTPASGAAFNVRFDFGAPNSSAGVTTPTGAIASQLSVLSQDGAAPTTSDSLHWKVDILDAKSVVQGTGDVRFNEDGTPTSEAASFTVTIKPENGPAFDVKFSFGAPGSFAGVTSIAGTTTSQVQLLHQDGVSLGTLTSTAFDDHGRLTLTYSNGKTKNVATLVLARFDNPDQLKEVGGAHFIAAGAQEPLLGAGLSEGFGSVVGGKIEMSNVDLTNQFTELIIVQRGFQGSSQVTSVANELLQQLLTMNGNR